MGHRRKKRDTELFFVRFKSTDEQDGESSYSPKLSQQADNKRPKVFVPITNQEKKYLMEKFKHKLAFAKTKDMD